jgi:hypothetical protein
VCILCIDANDIAVISEQFIYDHYTTSLRFLKGFRGITRPVVVLPQLLIRQIGFISFFFFGVRGLIPNFPNLWTDTMILPSVSAARQLLRLCVMCTAL